MSSPPHLPDLLRLNVGFLLKESVGYSRDVEFDVPHTIRIDDVHLSNLTGKLKLSRTPQGILADGLLDAVTEVACTRCLTPFNLPIHIEVSDELYAIPGKELSSDEEPVQEISEGGFIDITPVVRDESLLAQTLQLVCKPDCKGLCVQCGQNLNERQCDCEVESIDPRMAVLRSLLDE